MPSDLNVNISNGTCYFGKNNQTKGDFVPCGNVAFGNWPCCYLGDSCLGFQTANACYDPKSDSNLSSIRSASQKGLLLIPWHTNTGGNAYMAGCTDESYVDKTCPQKLDFKDQEWVGMQHCNTESDGEMDWGGCKVPPEDSTALVKLPNESCDPYCSTTLWVGTSDIPSFAIVPTSAGGSITWTSNFNPTSTSRPPNTAATAQATATHKSQHSGDGLSTGGKVGIGIASAAAALLIVGIISWCLILRRRKKKEKRAEDQQQVPHHGQPPGPHYPTYHVGSIYTAPSPVTTATLSPHPSDQSWHHSSSPKPYLISGNEAFTGYKHELPANEAQVYLSTSPPIGTTVSSSPDANSERVDSTVSEILPDAHGKDHVAKSYLSPQSTGFSEHRPSQTERSEPAIASELQG